MKISQSHVRRKAARYVQGTLHSDKIFTGAGSLAIFFKRAQATCLFPVLVLPETTCPGTRCPWSQGRKCGKQGVLLTCSVTVQMLTGRKHELGLTLGSIAHWLHVPEAGYLPIPEPRLS